MRKLGSDSSPSNISGETSSSLHVLLDKVKPVWVGAQGDRSEKGVLTVCEPLSTTGVSTLWHHPYLSFYIFGSIKISFS